MHGESEGSAVFREILNLEESLSPQAFRPMDERTETILGNLRAAATAVAVVSGEVERNGIHVGKFNVVRLENAIRRILEARLRLEALDIEVTRELMGALETDHQRGPTQIG